MSGHDEREPWGGYPTEPRPVGDGLEPLARRLGAPRVASLGAIFQRWDELVGPVVAAHCRPVSLRDGLLVVAVDEPGWATHVKFLSSDLQKRLEEAAGSGVVAQIEVRVVAARPAPISRSQGR